MNLKVKTKANALKADSLRLMLHGQGLQVQNCPRTWPQNFLHFLLV